MGDYTFKLSDVIDKTDIDHENIALIRHTKSHDNFRRVWDAGIDCFEVYQRIQLSRERVCVFICRRDKGYCKVHCGI